jgi:hypothetical protein
MVKLVGSPQWLGVLGEERGGLLDLTRTHHEPSHILLGLVFDEFGGRLESPAAG